MAGFGGGFNMARQGLVNDDFEVDGFLDNYLSQLQSTTNGNAVQQQNFAGLQQQQQPPRRIGMNTGPIPQSILQSQAALMGQMGGIPQQPFQPNPSQALPQGMQGFPTFGMQGFPMQPGMMGGPNMPPLGFNMGQNPLQFSNIPAASAGAAAAADAPQTTGTRRGRRKAKPKDDSPIEDNSGDDSDSDSSADGHKNRKKREVSKSFSAGADMTAAERKHLALQEKNRRAQRRFRERQKAKLQDLHKQIDELTHKVMSLQTENSTLHSRTSILEKVLDMRNEQIQVMQESREAVVAGAPLPAVDTSPMTLTVANGQAIQLTYDMLRELTPEQIYKIYQTYIKELSVKVVDYSKSEQQDAALAEQVEKLTREVVILLMRLSLLRPIEMRKFVAVSRQYHASEADAFTMWRKVVQSMKLSDQQQQETVQLKNMFMAKIEPIMEERRRLNVQIQANLPQDSFHTKNAITYIKTHEAVAKLRDNLRLEHNVVLDFCAALFQGVLRPHQMGSLLVQAYPVVPDALAVASAVASIMEVGSPGNSVAGNSGAGNALGGFGGFGGFGASFLGGFMPGGNMLAGPAVRTSSADSKDGSSPSNSDGPTPSAAAPLLAAVQEPATSSAAAAPLPVQPDHQQQQDQQQAPTPQDTHRPASASGSIVLPPASAPALAAPSGPSGMELLLAGTSAGAAAAAAAELSAAGQPQARQQGALPGTMAMPGSLPGSMAGGIPQALLMQSGRGVMMPAGPAGFPLPSGFGGMPGFGAGPMRPSAAAAAALAGGGGMGMGMPGGSGLGAGPAAAVAAGDARYPSFGELAKKGQSGQEQAAAGLSMWGTML